MLPNLFFFGVLLLSTWLPISRPSSMAGALALALAGSRESPMEKGVTAMRGCSG
jgi:hypothetical protein